LPLSGSAARLTHGLMRHLVWLGMRDAASAMRDILELSRWPGAAAAWAAMDRWPAFCAVSPA